MAAPDELHAPPRPDFPTPAEAASFLEACRRGDPAARRALWDRYARLVRVLLVRMLGPGHDVDDAVQETFLLVLRDLGKVRHPEALLAYVRVTTLNVARKERRRRRLRRLLGLEQPMDERHDVPAADGDPRAQAAARRVYAALDRMPEQERDSFLLRFVADMEIEDVAATLGLSRSTVKRRLASASQTLRALGQTDPLLAEVLTGRHGGAR